MVNTTVRHGADPVLVRQMTLETVTGTIQPFTDRSLTFPGLVHEVATLPVLMKGLFEAIATINREVETEVHHLLTEKGFL